jgi:hypothetical protein
MLQNRMTEESFERGFYIKAGFQHRMGFAMLVKPLANA